MPLGRCRLGRLNMRRTEKDHGEPVGTRVKLVSHIDDDTIYCFGYGIYEGFKRPCDFPKDQRPAGLLGQILVENEHDNPCIKMDDGNYIWGCECWWGEAEDLEAIFATQYKEYKLRNISIQKEREAHRQNTN